MASKSIIRRKNPQDVIHGTTNFLAPIHKFVVKDTANEDVLIKATNVRRPYCLEREILAEVPLSEVVFDTHILSPVKLGNHVSAKRPIFGEFEGPDYIHDSGTGVINAGTAVDTDLEVYDGRLRVAQEGNDVCGRVVNKLAAQEAGNLVRIYVEFFN